MGSMTRRQAFALPVAALTGAVTAPTLRAATALTEKLAALEAAHGGRLGVTAINHATGAMIGHRADERFAICSTFKFVLAALMLHRVDTGREQLDRRLPVRKSDIVPYAPVAEPRIGSTMSVEELCDAIVVLSDNAAANILLKALGGPAAVTAFVRALGDTVTRLDRMEPELNDVPPGDERDTTRRPPWPR